MTLSNGDKRHLKRRINSSIIDFILFFLLCPISFISIVYVANIQMNWILYYMTFFFFLYYAIFPKLTNGYTLAGLLFEIKIVKINGDTIALWEYTFRAVYAIFAYFRFLGYSRVRTNLLGQFYFDKPFGITTIGRTKICSLNIDHTKEFSFYFLGE